MSPSKIKSRDGPEKIIRDAIKKKLMSYGWHVYVTHGNEYQSGFPDLYCIHKRYGSRWVEVKNPKSYQFTKAQMETFPEFTSCNIGVWILTSDDEQELDKLFQPPNWWSFLSVSK